MMKTNDVGDAVRSVTMNKTVRTRNIMLTSDIKLVLPEWSDYL